MSINCFMIKETSDNQTLSLIFNTTILKSKIEKIYLKLLHMNTS
jgi:hypothetical protein